MQEQRNLPRTGPGVHIPGNTLNEGREARILESTSEADEEATEIPARAVGEPLWNVLCPLNVKLYDLTCIGFF